MKTSTVLLASAGVAAAQLTNDIAAISSAVGVLNSQVSGFSQAAQASAIVGQSNQIVSLINKAAADAKSGGMISETDATGLLQPFQNLQGAVGSAIDNLVSRKAIATSNSLGNVVEAQIVNQLSAAEAFASAVEAQLPSALQGIGTSLAAAILSDLSSGSSAFSGLSGPSTLGGSGSSPSSASASSTSGSSSAASTGSSSAASTGSSSSSAAGSTTTGGSSSSAGTTTSSAPTASTTVIQGGGADKTVVSFFGVIAAAFVGMVAL